MPRTDDNGLRRGVSLSALLVILIALLPAALRAQDVTEIRVEGNHRVTAERIIGLSRLHPDEPYSPMKIQRALRDLFDSGLFEDAEILGEEREDGVLLILRVSENPTIHEIHVEGVKALGEADVRKALTLREGALFSPSAVVESKNGILSKYREEGYPLARVDVEQTEVGEGAVDLSVVIDEGKRVDVERIDFEGNERFSDSDLRGEMKTEQDGFWFWQGTHYKEDVLREDLDQRIVQFYRNRGFLDFYVEGHETKFDRERGKAYITIRVVEGDRYHVGTVEFEGNEFFGDDVLRERLGYAEGDVFSQKRYDDSLGALYEVYGNQGYLYADINPFLRREGTTANVTYYIVENDPAYIRKVIIQGNEITHEKVIRRELVILPGDRFKQRLLVQSFRELMNTGYFENVDIQRKPTADSRNDIDLVFDVTEKRTGQASTGAGFGAGGGLTGFIELSQSNLFGRGQQAHIRLEHGSRQTNFEFGFTEPFFHDTRTSVGVDLFRVDQAFTNDPFRRRSTGGSLRVGVPMPGMDFTRFFTTYRLERFELDPQGGASVDPADPLFEDFPRLLSGLTFGLVRDTRDNTFHPSSGTRHSLTAEYAGGLLGGSTDFQKYRLSTAWSMPSLLGFNLTLRAKGGIITGYGDPSTVPINERFILGGIGPGIEGLRGYPDRSVGPIEGGTVNRGRSFLLLTAEEELKITNQVYGVLFFDAGNAWDSFSAADPTDLKRGIGFGVRVEIPGMGPLGLDIGYGLDRPDGPGFEPHVTFGAFF